MLSDMVHGKVDRRFTGPEEIEHDGVLCGEVRESSWVIPELICDALQAAADDGGLVD